MKNTQTFLESIGVPAARQATAVRWNESLVGKAETPILPSQAHHEAIQIQYNRLHQCAPDYVKGVEARYKAGKIKTEDLVEAIEQAKLETQATDADPIVSRIVKNKIVNCLWSMLTEAEKRAAYNAMFTQ